MKLGFKIFILAIISLLAVLIWYSPILMQGYAYNPITPEQGQARNLALTGKFSAESPLNIILSSDKIKDSGAVSSAAEKLIPVSSALIYKYAGAPSENKAIIIALFICAITLFIFSILTWKLFDYKTAVIFSLVYIFLPVNWNTNLLANYYEYSLLFLALGLLAFFWPVKKYDIVKYILAGIFMALSFYGRNAIGVLFPAILIWSFIYNRKVIIPFFSSLIISVFIINILFAFFFGSSGNYHLAFFGSNDKKTVASEFYFYGHLYPDPYTYHFEKEDYISSLEAKFSGNSLEAQNIRKRLENVESISPSIWHDLKLAPVLLAKHISNFFSLYYLGGPFIFLLILLGLYRLKDDDRKLAQFGFIWIATVIFFLSFIVIAQRNHLMDFSFMITLFLTLGIIELSELLNVRIVVKNKKLKLGFVSVIVILIVIYQLIIGNRIFFASNYRNNNKLLLYAYKEKIIENKIGKDDIIATPLNTLDLYTLNYLTNRSVVRFDADTIKQLIDNKKLGKIFKEFGVTKIIGYSPELSEEITRNSNANNIADDRISIRQPQISSARMLLLNIIR